jgi:hypothetical protein
MKHLGAAFLAAALLVSAVLFSRSMDTPPPAPAGDLAIQVEARNPWTHTRVNREDDDFQFAIVSDRTGSHRANVFARAVEKLNLLQPEFVLSIGDLIEGGNKEDAKLDAEWKELNGLVERLQMPFFYVPGNHDHGTKKTAALWKEKFGRSYYHFLYNNVLFLCLNTEDPPGSGAGHLSAEQLRYATEVLDNNRSVRWTIVAFHKPIWKAANVEATGLLELEKALGERPYTVFVGHVHRYEKFVRRGREYYQLATTGGGSKMRGVPYGEFDHIVWVTMKRSGPVLANVLLDAILPEDLSTPEVNEPGTVIRGRQATQPVHGKLLFEGTPAAGAVVTFQPVKGRQGGRFAADATVEADGTYVLSTYTAGDGAPEGEYIVTAVWRRPATDGTGAAGPNQLPERYAKVETSPLKAVIKPGPNEVVLELHR